jgi:hypothetical protein
MSDQHSGDDSVVTPGGPRMRSQVREVSSSEAVTRGLDGELEIRPQPHLLTPRLSSLLDSGDFVITPGGPRRKELVHTVHPDETVTSEHSISRKVDATGNVIAQPEDIIGSEVQPTFGRGWITYASLTYSGSNPISSFSTTWTVPDPPATQAKQLIYLFSGLQDSPVGHILQPVLQWGVSPDGGGGFWAVASWFVDSGGNAFKSPLINVNTGDTLIGLMTLTGQSASGFSYKCEFTGINGTSLVVNNVSQLVMPVETLECYGIQGCGDYPGSRFTAMTSISLRSTTGAISTSFVPVNAVTDCGQHCVVDSAPGNAVELWYAGG